MTREEKIEILEKEKVYMLAHGGDRQAEALTSAIKALEQEPCDDAISRQIISDYVESHIQEINTGYGDLNEHTNRILRMIMEYIDKLPPAKLQEPKTAHWIEIAKYSDGRHEIECSECGSHIFDRGHANSYVVKEKYKYCPRCGFRMIEPQESEEI